MDNWPTAYRIINNHFYVSPSPVNTITGVPYIEAIREGLALLDVMGADDHTKAAYCLHPITQDSDELQKLLHPTDSLLLDVYNKLDLRVWILAMEFRSVANMYRCNSSTDKYTVFDLPETTIPEVRSMLIADKVQGYKDFLRFHKNTHQRAYYWHKYFNNWFQALGVDYEDPKWDVVTKKQDFDPASLETSEVQVGDIVKYPRTDSPSGEYYSLGRVKKIHGKECTLNPEIHSVYRSEHQDMFDPSNYQLMVNLRRKLVEVHKLGLEDLI